MGKDKFNITINRLYGSGGRIMGKRLSEELGIPFYDEEILKMASEESAIGEHLFRLNDEKAGSNLFFRALGGLKTSLEEPSPIVSPGSQDPRRRTRTVPRRGGGRNGVAGGAGLKMKTRRNSARSAECRRSAAAIGVMSMSPTGGSLLPPPGFSGLPGLDSPLR